MTRWPLTCEECGAGVYLGSLWGGKCHDCHITATVETLTKSSGQTALGDFA